MCTIRPEFSLQRNEHLFFSEFSRNVQGGDPAKEDVKCGELARKEILP